MNRFDRGLVLLAAAASGLAAPARGQDSLAERFPADAVVYFEADTRRLVDGAAGLDVVKLLDEPQVREFLAPMAADLPAPVSSSGLRDLLESLPWRQLVAGRVQFALRGLNLDVDGQTIELSPSQPLSARQFNRLLGLAARVGAGGEDAMQATRVDVAADFVACIDAGPGFAPHFEQLLGMLRQHGVGLTSEECTIGGLGATKYSISVHEGAGNHTVPIHVVREGDRWWFGGVAGTLERALQGREQHSLARSRDFQAFRRQVSDGDPVVLAYVDVGAIGRGFERLIPPIVKEELDLLGISSIEAFGGATTFVAGGVRDTWALTYSEPPRGLLSLLDCTDGEMGFLACSPANTGAYVGLRISPEAFVDKLLAVSAELFPGSEEALAAGLAKASAELGMDVRQELLAALGDEIGVYLTAIGAGSVIPDGLLMFEIGDREQFEKLLARALQESEANAGIRATPVKSMPEGTRGFTLEIPEAGGIVPAIAVTDDALFVSANVLTLKKSIREIQGGLEQTARDNENLQRVLSGLSGAPTTDGLSFLAFVDLQKLVEFGYGFLPMVAGNLTEATDGKLDPAAIPETEVVARHFSGVGVAGRSDAHGLAVSFFTPAGVELPAIALGSAFVLTTVTKANAIEEDRERMAASSEPAATPDEAHAAPARAARSRTLADLFSAIERATGATIDYPVAMSSLEVSYTARSGDLETVLGELAAIAGFTFEIRDVAGDKLVVVRKD